MKKIIDIYEASILADIEDTFSTGDNYAEMYGWFNDLKDIDRFPKVVDDLINDIKKNGGKKITTTTKGIEPGNYYVKITHYIHSLDSYNLRFYWPKPEQPLDWKYCDVFRKKVEPEYEDLITDGTNGYQNVIHFSHKDKFNTSSRSSLRPARYKKPDSEELYLLPEKYKTLIEILKLEGDKGTIIQK